MGWDEPTRDAFMRMQYALQCRAYTSQHPQSNPCVIELRDPGQAPVAVGRLWFVQDRHALRLLDISLLARHRGGGVGERCLRRLQDIATEVRLPLRLHVNPSNPARRLYERLGFLGEATHDMYMSMSWTPATVSSSLETLQ